MDQTKTMKEENVKQLTEGLSVSILGKFGGRGIDLVVQILLASHLTTAMYGLYAIVVTLLRILGNIASLGLEQGVIRFGARYWNRRSTKFVDVALQGGLLSLLSGGLFAGSLYILAPFISEGVYQYPELIPVIRLGALYLIFFSTARVISNTSRIAKKFSYSILGFEFGFPVLEILLIAICIYSGITLQNAVLAKVIAIAVSFGVSALILIFIIRNTSLTPEEHRFFGKSLILYSLPVSLAGIFYNMLQWSDRLILGFFMPESEVGIYQAVNQFPAFFLLLLSAVNLVFFPMIGDLMDKKDHQGLNNLYGTAVRYGLYASTPVLIFLLVFPEEIITLFFSSDFTAGRTALQILALAQFINVSTGSVGPLLVISNNQDKWLITNVVGFGSAVVLNFFLVPRYGITGSALGTGFAIVILFGLGILFVRRELDLWPYTRATLKLFLSLPITLLLVLLLKNWIQMPSHFSSVLLFGFLTVIIYLLSLLIIGIHPEDRALIKELVEERFRGRT